jgi:hypothetical protein
MKSKMTINECGDKFWKLPGGKYHREDGPAVVLPSGGKSWYLNNINYTEQEHKFKMRDRKLKELLQ